MPLFGLAVLILWLGAGYSVRLQYAGAERAAVDSAGNLARVFEQHIVRTIQAIDQTLLNVRASFQRMHLNVGEWADQHGALTDFTTQISIVDENGFLASTNLSTTGPPVDLRSHEHFRVHAETSEDNLFISKPVLGQVSKKWSLQFTRRLSGEQNAFAGVVVISVDPDHLTNFYNSIDIGRQGAVVLLGRDGVHRARAPHEQTAQLTSYAGHPFLTRMLNSRSGTATIAEDGIVRIYSYREVTGYPLIVAVGIGQDDAFASARTHRNVIFGVTAALSIIVLGLAWRSSAQQDRLVRARAEMQTRSSRYQRVVNGIDQIIFQLDAGGGCLFLNAAWTRIMGYSADETLGRNLIEFIHAEDREDLDLSRASRSPETSFDPVRFVTKSGEVRWLRVHTQPEFGNGDGLYGTLTDVTSWYEAQRAKREADARALAILESAADGILSIDAAGIIERVNPGLLRMFRIEEHLLIGKPITLLAPVEGNESNWRFIQRVLDDGPISEQGWWGDMTCRRGDGTLFPAGVRLSEMQLPNGRHLCCIVRDITERKKIEQIKDDFVATVSHELRTPMAAIIGSLGLIKSGAIGGLPAKAVDLVDMAHRNCGRLVRLLDNILDMERIGSGQVDLSLSEVDINQIVADAISLSRPYAEEKRIAFEIEPFEPAAIVRADADRMTQVLTNLISNALKYSPQGEIITVRVAEHRSRYRVCVIDKGRGVPEEFKPHMFKRFARAESPDNHARGGTGLGLFICKLILEQHGGTIGFTSESGKGATFYFELGTGRAQGIGSIAA